MEDRSPLGEARGEDGGRNEQQGPQGDNDVESNHEVA